MTHEFIKLKFEDVPEIVMYDLREGHDVVEVDDDIILNNHYFISTGQRPKPPHITGFKTFLVYFDNVGDGLAYHGNTIIPTTSLPKFIENIQQAKKKIRKRKYLKEMDNLIDLCNEALQQNMYVIHFGI